MPPWKCYFGLEILIAVLNISPKRTPIQKHSSVIVVFSTCWNTVHCDTMKGSRFSMYTYAMTEWTLLFKFQYIKSFINSTKYERDHSYPSKDEIDSLFGLLVALAGLGAMAGSLVASLLSDNLGRSVSQEHVSRINTWNGWMEV